MEQPTDFSLAVPEPLATTYRQSAADLMRNFDLPEISAELLMRMCLAAPTSDDLKVGFCRGDLRVVSVDEHTRSIVEREIRFLGQDQLQHSGTDTSLGSKLAGCIPEAKKSESAALRQFMQRNPESLAELQTLDKPTLIRLAMLFIKREADARARSYAVLKQWYQTLPPQVREHVAALWARYGTGAAANTTSRSIGRETTSRPNVRVT